MHKLIAFLTLVLAFVSGCSAGPETSESYGEQDQLICTAQPIASGWAGCVAPQCSRSDTAISGIRGASSNYELFEVYRNGAWQPAVDFDPTYNGGQTLGPTGLHFIGSIGGPGYPTIQKLVFTPTTYWCGTTSCPGTKITAGGATPGAFPQGNEIAIHGGWVTCQSPPCAWDVGASLMKVAAVSGTSRFTLRGNNAGSIKEFAIANACSP